MAVWIVAGFVAWVVLSFPLGLLIGRLISMGQPPLPSTRPIRHLTLVGGSV